MKNFVKTWGIFIVSSTIEISIAVLYTYEAVFMKYVPLLDNLTFFYLLIVYMLASFFAIVFMVNTQDHEPESTKNRALFELQRNRKTYGGKFRRVVGISTDVLIVVSIALTSPVKAAFLGALLFIIISIFNTAVKKAIEPPAEI